jgi:hypothetical protein
MDRHPEDLTLVLVVEGPPRLAARSLAARYPQARAEAQAVHVALRRGETPEGVLAQCRENRIGVRASCVLRRAARPHAFECCDLPPSPPPSGSETAAEQEVHT